MGRDVGGYGHECNLSPKTQRSSSAAMDMLEYATTTLANLSGINESTIISNIPVLEKAAYQKKVDLICNNKELFQLYQEQVRKSHFTTELGARAVLVDFAEFMLAEDQKSTRELPGLLGKLNLTKSEISKHPDSPTQSISSSVNSNLSPLSDSSETSGRKITFSIITEGLRLKKKKSTEDSTDSTTASSSDEGSHPLLPSLDHSAPESATE